MSKMALGEMWSEVSDTLGWWGSVTGSHQNILLSLTAGLHQLPRQQNREEEEKEEK